MAPACHVAALPRSTEKRDRVQFGTVPAINCSSKSGAPFAAEPVLSTHGGARLRGDRASDHLKLHHARAIIRAAQATDKIGAPFTRMVTVHWERAGIANHLAAAATGKLTKLMQDWARRRGARIHWAWTRECDQSKGNHLHMLLACPAHLPIGRMWRRWLRLITGRPYRAKVINTRRIGGTLSASACNPAAYLQNLSATVAYVCKGMRTEDAARLGITRIEPGGCITGKRSAVCQPLLALIKNAGPPPP